MPGACASSCWPRPRSRARGSSGSRWRDRASSPRTSTSSSSTRSASSSSGSGPEAVLLALRGPLVRVVAPVIGASGDRPVLVSGFPGLTIPAEPKAVIYREQVDLIVLHSRREVREFRANAEHLGVPVDLGLATLPFLRTAVRQHAGAGVAGAAGAASDGIRLDGIRRRPHRPRVRRAGEGPVAPRGPGAPPRVARGCRTPASAAPGGREGARPRRRGADPRRVLRLRRPARGPVGARRARRHAAAEPRGGGRPDGRPPRAGVRPRDRELHGGARGGGRGRAVARDRRVRGGAEADQHRVRRQRPVRRGRRRSSRAPRGILRRSGSTTTTSTVPTSTTGSSGSTGSSRGDGNAPLPLARRQYNLTGGALRRAFERKRMLGPHDRSFEGAAAMLVALPVRWVVRRVRRLRNRLAPVRA